MPERHVVCDLRTGSACSAPKMSACKALPRAGPSLMVPPLGDEATEEYLFCESRLHVRRKQHARIGYDRRRHVFGAGGNGVRSVQEVALEPVVEQPTAARRGRRHRNPRAPPCPRAHTRRGTGRAVGGCETAGDGPGWGWLSTRNCKSAESSSPSACPSDGVAFIDASFRSSRAELASPPHHAMAVEPSLGRRHP